MFACLVAKFVARGAQSAYHRKEEKTCTLYFDYSSVAYVFLSAQQSHLYRKRNRLACSTTQIVEAAVAKPAFKGFSSSPSFLSESTTFPC